MKFKKIVKEAEDPALKKAYEDIEDNWEGQLDWVDDNEFTFALSYYNDGDDIGEVTDYMKDLAKEYGLKCDSTHDGHYVFWKEDVVNESRMPVMWAIDYRDMHTAIHGLIYGKNRRDVEQFYDRLKVIYADDDISPDEQEMCYQDLWDEFYPRIQQIDEINFRDIGKLPSGKYGIIIDDVEYRLVNNVSIDLYEESKKVQQEESTKRCSKMKFKKIVKESDDDDSIDHPRIYVGTYAKYNDGSIDGKWIDLTKYDTYEEFVDACRELHKDEKDPEFMVQDYENFPEKWYHEGGLPSEEEFDKINEYYMMDYDRKAAYEAYVNHTNDDDIEHFEEAYQGHFDSATDFAYDLVDNIGWDGIGQNNLDMYFDYAAFGRDLMMDYSMGDPDMEDADGEPQKEDHYYDQDGYDMGEYESDEQVAYDFIDNLGGVDQLGKDTAQNYFDYDSFGRDLLISDYFEEDGYVFLRM